jgi:hypothetical protein
MRTLGAMRITDAEAARIIRQARAAMPSLRPRDPFKAALATCQDQEADYQRRLARWERDQPKRDAAERAHLAARERRRAEPGQGRASRPVRVPVLAAWADQPVRPVMW